MANDEHDLGYKLEVDCIYKGEKYSVRDNGAIFRHARINCRTRPNDNEWTFGKPNSNGYLVITAVPVHRITATAFHGVPPSDKHVVDHIDTNRWNNRPENLRWLTRLDNLILNPITAKRIAMVCGSVEAFLANPKGFSDKFPDPNFEWMRTVTAEEAQASYERLLLWANNDKVAVSGSLDSWIFNHRFTKPVPIDNTETTIAEDISSLNSNAKQRDWRTPSEFPCCPNENTSEPLMDYAKKLEPGLIFCTNDIYRSNVLKSVLSSDQRTIFVLSESKESIKPWGLAEITFEGDFFMHKNLGTFFSQEGAEKQYCLAQGLEWSGEDSIDDYC